MNTDSGRQERGTYYEQRIALALARANAAASGAAFASVLVFRPGGVRAGNVYTTWAGIKAALTPGCKVLVDSSLAPAVVPGATGVTNMTGVSLGGYNSTFSFATGDTVDVLTIADGATLANLRAVELLTLDCDCKTVPSLSFVQSAVAPIAVWNLEDAIIQTTLTATRPACEVTSNLLVFGRHNTLFGQAGAPEPVFHITSTGALFLTIELQSFADPSSVTSDVGGTFNYTYDADTFAPTLAFPGVPALSFAPLRVTLEAWIEPNADTTANRPPASATLPGERFFDTSINGQLTRDSSNTLWIGPALFGDAIGVNPTTTPLAAATASVLAAKANDSSGQVTITPTGPGALARITFTAPLSEAPEVYLTATNGPGASSQFYVSNKTASFFEISALGVPVVGPTPVSYSYLVIPHLT